MPPSSARGRGATRTAALGGRKRPLSAACDAPPTSDMELSAEEDVRQVGRLANARLRARHRRLSPADVQGVAEAPFALGSALLMCESEKVVSALDGRLTTKVCWRS